MSSLAELLRRARRENKMTQKALGARLGLPQSHVSAIESGKVDPRLSSVLEIARVLDLEPMFIPRAHVTAVRALIEGKPDDPLWMPDDEEEETDEGEDGL
jgi:transcriptional regulator with XRE-family HTH domain